MAQKRSSEQQIADAVVHELKQVVDPELGVPITDLQLVDQVDIDEGVCKVSFHLTMPFCPDEFVVMMADDINNRLRTVRGIKKVEVVVSNHVHATQLNKLLRRRHSSLEAA